MLYKYKSTIDDVRVYEMYSYLEYIKDTSGRHKQSFYLPRFLKTWESVINDYAGYFLSANDVAYYYNEAGVMPGCMGMSPVAWASVEDGNITFPTDTVGANYNYSCVLNETQTCRDTGLIGGGLYASDRGIILGSSTRSTQKIKSTIYDTWDSKIHRRAGNSGNATFLGNDPAVAFTYIDIVGHEEVWIQRPFGVAVVATSSNLAPGPVGCFISGGTTEPTAGYMSAANIRDSYNDAAWFVPGLPRSSGNFSHMCRRHDNYIDTSTCVNHWHRHDITPPDWGEGITMNNGRTYNKLWLLIYNFMACGVPTTGDLSTTPWDPWLWASCPGYQNWYLVYSDPIIQFGTIAGTYGTISSGEAAILYYGITASKPLYTSPYTT